MKEWQVQSVLAGVLAAMGLYVLINPLGLVSLIQGIVPWLLMGAGGIYLMGVMWRKGRWRWGNLVPAAVGLLLVYAGVSLKFGDPRTVGPIGVPFLLGLVLIGGGIAKLIAVPGLRRSAYLPFFAGSAVVSVLLGLVVLFAWSTVSAGAIGFILGLEIIADALFLAGLALRARDKEEHKEALGLPPG